MLPSQTSVYLLVPNESNERVLHPGRVVVLEGDDQLVIEIAATVLLPASGTGVNLFFEQGTKFMQQGATLIEAREPMAVATTTEAPASGEQPGTEAPAEPTRAICIRPEGKPVSAESRGSYRVSVAALEIPARVEKERDCRLVDVSPEGFAAVMRTNHRLGTVVKVKTEYEGEHLDGRVRVQTVKPLAGGKFRIGFLCPSTEATMRRSLQKLTSAVQRAQLQRLRRSA